MTKPKPKRKYAACGACRGKGLVWETGDGTRVTQEAAMEIRGNAGRVALRFCTCELGEAKREAAKETKR